MADWRDGKWFDRMNITCFLIFLTSVFKKHSGPFLHFLQGTITELHLLSKISAVSCDTFPAKRQSFLKKSQVELVGIFPKKDNQLFIQCWAYT